jgi:chitodextrinase
MLGGMWGAAPRFRRQTRLAALIGVALGVAALAPATVLAQFESSAQPASTRLADKQSAPLQARRRVRDKQPPTRPTGLRQVASSHAKIFVQWKPSRDNRRVRGYRVYLQSASVGTTQQTNYVFGSLRCNSTYSVSVAALDAAGNRSLRAWLRISTRKCKTRDTQAPTAPAFVEATGSTADSVAFAWPASLDNVGVAGYDLFSNGNKVGTTTATSYTFGSLSCGTSYTLAVDAYDGAGNRSPSAAVQASTSPCPDTSPPTVPGLPTQTGSTATSISILWSASLDNVGVAGYDLFSNGNKVGTTTATSYTFGSLSCGTSYTLGVDAYDGAGNHSGQATITGTTSACSAGSPSVFVATTGADTNSCTQAAPCKTFQRAYNVAQPGGVVEVAAGNYPDQTINGTKSAPSVVFQPASGASVYVNDFFIYATNLELRNFGTSYWETHASANGVTMRNIDTGPFIIYGSSNVNVIGGDIGPSYGNGSATNDAFITYENGTIAPHNIVIDGAYFHDFKLGYVGDHGQCLMVVGGVGITIRNSRFQRCDIYSIFFTQWAGPDPPSNVLLENNFFDKSTNYGSYTQCCTYYSVQFAAHMSNFTNITVRNNSSLQPISFEAGPPVSNVQVIANVGPLDGCSSGVSYLYNVSSGVKCGTTDKTAPSGFVDPSTLNLHLAPGSAAINAGDPASYPSADIDGQSRPMGGTPDAGADEAG